MRNFKSVRTFEDGHSTDLKDNLERGNTFQKGINGRLYNNNGVLSFNAIEGSKLVYSNNQIVKYLGYHSFDDEIIVFAKCLKPEDNSSGSGNTEQICETSISSNSFVLASPLNIDDPLSVTSEISDNSTETENCYTVTNPPENETDFELNYSCDGLSSDVEIDFGEYYGLNPNVPNFLNCSINQDIVPLHNEIFDDCIYSFKIDETNSLVGTLLWVGHQNWPMNAKITCEGNEENEYYKRVYYTDAFNPRRVVNIKNTSLINMAGNEFNQVLNNVLLQPKVQEIVPGGQLNSMKSIYLYRIVSQNGQLSEFSPTSFYANILPEDEPVNYRGGDISEETSKLVVVTCDIINANENSEVECIAVEYEALGAPTAIRNLGRKPASGTVEFKHYGNEPEFIDDITLSDLVEAKNSWKYCNDFTSKKNKLIAGGLRNEPTPTDIENLEYLLPLHSWDQNGDTHNCLINPRPWEYRYIDPTNTEKLIYIKQKAYETLSLFGPSQISLKNTETGNSISLSFNDLNLESYTSVLDEVYDWLNTEQQNASFSTTFPNLLVEKIGVKILFKPIDENIQTDMSNYVFESNNNQFVQNFNNDIQFLDVSVDTSNLVYGAQSIGFNEGVGIRVTYRRFKKPLLEKATEIYDGTNKLLDYHKPSEEKFFMKGEIYRLSFQTYDNDSTRFFSIPLGDLMIPKIGELVKEIDDSGNVIISSEKYINQTVEGNTLYGHGIKMHIEVRLSCELKELIPMYQILYVERNEENRTILCQGISAPLNRVQDTGSESHRMPDEVRNKWNLPYYGGPTYEYIGLQQYDIHGENHNTNSEAEVDRVITHRGLMYFDSPDLYYNKISDQYIKSSILNVVGKIKTDHTPSVIRERGGNISSSNFFGSSNYNTGNEVYPKFSRKILEHQIEGNNHSGDLPRASVEDRRSGSYETHFINVSVYPNFTPSNLEIGIDKAETLLRGEEISGTAFDLSNDVSNNTFCLPNQPWYYGNYQRKWGFQSGRANSVIFRSGTISPGYKTTIIKSAEDLFTPDFIGAPVGVANSQIRLGGVSSPLFDTLPIINIFKNNRESVFGGRTKEALSQNTYIPLSKTIPTNKSDNGAQYFDVDGDVFVTLNIRTKNDYGHTSIVEDEMNNDGGGRAKGDIKAWKRNGAWTYVVVLETQVEPKWTYQYEFYRETGKHNFNISRPEIINEAYFNENSLKTYVPKPFKFKNDPNREHVVAVSDTKLAGELYDSWTNFKPNNYYSQLEKNKGPITNLVKDKDKIYAIQKNQTSILLIGTERFITDQEGNPINVKQGSGTVVDGHQVISNFGTGIRRAAISNAEFNFSFFDESKNEFIKINEPLLLQNLLHLHYNDIFKNDPVIDTECYYDHNKKETNICVKLKSGIGYLISYNEMLKKFNGIHQYNNDLYMMHRNNIYIPLRTGSDENTLSENVHQLNEGSVLNLAGDQKELILGFILTSGLEAIVQHKMFEVITDIDYPIKSFFINSNLGYDRTILGNHIAYKIREGNHTVPSINESNNFFGNSDVRGNQIYVEIVVESIDNNKVSILAVNNHLRVSHL